MAVLRILFAAFLLAALASGATAATQGAATVDDGYAGKALEKILRHYSASLPPGQQIEAKLFLDGDGRYLDCRAVKGDVKALCKAAKAAAPFGEPPYGVDTSIILAFSAPGSEQKKLPAAQAAQAPAAASQPDAKYAAKATRALRERIYIPEKTRPGSYHASARVQYDSAGKILDCAILQSSGDKLLDRYILQGIRRAGAVPPPPGGKGGSLDARFTLTRK